jgi:hypothetical protein
MGTGSQAPAGLDGSDRDSALHEYTFAYENRNQADASAWEMTAIMWGAQTLLLGFVLEAIGDRPAQPLIVFLVPLGIMLSYFSYVVMRARRIVCLEMIRICCEIEDSVPMVVKPQSRLNKVYPAKKLQTFPFWIINLMLSAIWILVGLRALALYCHHWSR